jgi:hypothetical protein
MQFYVRPMPPQHGTALPVLLDLPHHAHAGALQTKIQSAGA